MSSGKKIMLSGVKPTGRPHIGNYLGAMRQFVDFQDKFESHIFLADLHALTTTQDASTMMGDSLDLIIDYLAIGLDPQKTTLFKQSDIPEHAELSWIFNCITTMPYLARAHAYKDAVTKDKEINVGVFDYPMLMVADILMYDADVVPVGQDQKQHVEYARDTAEKFNRIFGETFKLPEPYILADVGAIPGIDGRKMSKSYNNHIPLFASPDELKSLVMSIKTDSKGVKEAKNPNECIVFVLHRHFSQKDLPNLEKRYREGGIGYKESKEILLTNMETFFEPLRERRARLAADPQKVIDILHEGTAKARLQAQKKLQEVKEKTGLSL